jgi:hypothetical protein
MSTTDLIDHNQICLSLIAYSPLHDEEQVCMNMHAPRSLFDESFSFLQTQFDPQPIFLAPVLGTA